MQVAVLVSVALVMWLKREADVNTLLAYGYC